MSKSYFQYLNYNPLFTNIFHFHQKAKKNTAKIVLLPRKGKSFRLINHFFIDFNQNKRIKL